MNVIDSNSGDAELPIVFRWKEIRPDGYISWFVSGLEANCQFWGYAHFRTDSDSRNRSFVGQLDQLKYEQINQVINGSVLQPVEIPTDGLVGSGTRSNFKTLIGYNRESGQSDRFMEIVSILLPELRLALRESA